MSDREPRASGATPVAGAGHRRAWLWVLVALALITSLLFALGRCGAGIGPVAAPDPGDAGRDTTTAPTGAGSATADAPPPAGVPAPAPDTTAVTAPRAPRSPAAAPAPGDQGSLLGGDGPLLPVDGAAGPDGSLADRVGEQVTATAVTVRSVPADEGFWVGTSDVDRVWVQLVGEGESAFAVRPGDRVDFDGRLVAHDTAFAGDVGVDRGEGADQLSSHGAHVEVRQAELRIASR